MISTKCKNGTESSWRGPLACSVGFRADVLRRLRCPVGQVANLRTDCQSVQPGSALLSLVVCGKQNNEYPAKVGQPILAAAGFQPAFPAGAYVYFGAKEPPKRRQRAELPAPHSRHDFGRTKLGASETWLTPNSTSSAADRSITCLTVNP